MFFVSVSTALKTDRCPLSLQRGRGVVDYNITLFCCPYMSLMPLLRKGNSLSLFPTSFLSLLSKPRTKRASQSARRSPLLREAHTLIHSIKGTRKLCIVTSQGVPATLFAHKSSFRGFRNTHEVSCVCVFSLLPYNFHLRRALKRASLVVDRSRRFSRRSFIRSLHSHLHSLSLFDHHTL